MVHDGWSGLPVLADLESVRRAWSWNYSNKPAKVLNFVELQCPWCDLDPPRGLFHSNIMLDFIAARPRFVTVPTCAASRGEFSSWNYKFTCFWTYHISAPPPRQSPGRGIYGPSSWG